MCLQCSSGIRIATARITYSPVAVQGKKEAKQRQEDLVVRVWADVIPFCNNLRTQVSLTRWHIKQQACAWNDCVLYNVVLLAILLIIQAVQFQRFHNILRPVRGNLNYHGQASIPCILVCYAVLIWNLAMLARWGGDSEKRRTVSGSDQALRMIQSGK